VIPLFLFQKECGISAPAVPSWMHADGTRLSGMAWVARDAIPALLANGINGS